MVIKTIEHMPIIYGKASTGKIKMIKYYVEQLDDNTFDIVNEHGYIDGKLQMDRRNIKVGKNIGKANETSALEQAVSEMRSKYQKKLDKNYTTNESGEPDNVALLPMLAHRFDKRKHNIKYPCIVQPKLNGVRMMLGVNPDNDFQYTHTSRGGKEYTTLSHIDKDVVSFLEHSNPWINILKTPLDGEVYIHGMSLQEINRRVKKYRPGQTEELQYWVYDICNPHKRNGIRDAALMTMYMNAKNAGVDIEGLKVIIVSGQIAESEEDIKKYHDEYVQEGFEGVIIRNIDGLYQFDKRSADLQKYKEFLDDEYLIVGYGSGEGRETDAIIFKCNVKDPTPDGPKTFDVRSRGSVESRKEMMVHGEKYIGEMLTVRYFDLSEDNVPSFPVGVGIRLKEDM